MDDLTLRLHTEAIIIEDLGVNRPEGSDAPMSYAISVQLGTYNERGYPWFEPFTIHTQASPIASDEDISEDISNVTRRALVALADLIGERMRRGSET